MKNQKGGENVYVNTTDTRRRDSYRNVMKKVMIIRFSDISTPS